MKRYEQTEPFATIPTSVDEDAEVTIVTEHDGDKMKLWVDIRVYFTAKDGTRKPSRRGLRVSVDGLSDIIDTLDFVRDVVNNIDEMKEVLV